MRVTKGGTDMYCPSCKEVTTCKAVPAAQVTYNPSDYGQRKYYSTHNDIQIFQRGRECLSCRNEFVSAEVDLQFLEELVELRGALTDLKGNAEAFVKQSAAASVSLEKLSDSLGVLRALKVYKSEKKR